MDEKKGERVDDVQPYQVKQKEAAQPRTERAMLYVADHLMCGLVVGPLVVLAWRGMWNLLNIGILPDDLGGSAVICCAVGNAGLMTLALIQGLLKTYVRDSSSRSCLLGSCCIKGNSSVCWSCKCWNWLFSYHVYICVCFFFNVCHWRGIWFILDNYAGISPVSAGITYAIGQGGLILFRSTKNAQAPPMCCAMDTDREFFTYTTRFRAKPGVNERYLWDVFFTVFIIHQLVVFYWRGAWELFDAYLVPEDLGYSGVYSLVFSYILMVIVFALQPLGNFLYRKTRNVIVRWVLETILYFLSNLVNVSAWRGFWLISEAYILTDRPIGSAVLTLVVGLGGLMLLVNGSSVCIRGCEMDGDSADEDGCYVPNKYFSYFVAQCRSRRSRKDKKNDDKKEQINEAFESSDTETGTPSLERNLHISTITSVTSTEQPDICYYM